MAKLFLLVAFLASVYVTEGYAIKKTSALEASILARIIPGYRVTLPLSAFGYRVRNLKVNSCGSNSHIRLDSLTVDDDIAITFTGEVFQPIVAPLRIDLELQKKVFFWIKLPCLFGKFGSCTYDDICAQLAESPTAHDDLEAAGLPRGCPFPAGQYSAQNYIFRMNFDSAAPQIPSFLGNGDYKAKVTVKQGGEAVACYNVELSLEDVDRSLL